MVLLNIKQALRKSIEKAAAGKFSSMTKNIPVQGGGSGGLTPKMPSAPKPTLPSTNPRSPGIQTPTSLSGLDMMAPRATPSQGLQSPGAAFVESLGGQAQP